MEKRVITLPKWLKALPLVGVGLIVAMLFLAQPVASAAVPVNPNASICLPGVVCATVTLPGTTITLPGRTITLPGRTVTLPQATTVKTVTSKVKVPGPVTTKYITPAPKILYRTSTQTVTQTGQTITKSARVTTATVTATATRTDVRTVEKERVVNLTTPQATGISLGLIVAGALLALLVLYIMYRLGYLRAEDQNAEDWKDLRDSLKE